MAIKRYTRYKRDKRKVKIQERTIVLAPDAVQSVPMLESTYLY